MNRRDFLAAGASTLMLPGCATRSSQRLPATLAWSKLPAIPYRGKQDDIAFGSALTGWYGNGEGRIFRTLDRGDSWSQVWHRPGTFVRALGFINEKLGIMGNVGVGAFPNVTDTKPLYRTVDGGATWTPARIDGPMPPGICAIEIVRSPFIDRGERIVAHAAGRRIICDRRTRVRVGRARICARSPPRSSTSNSPAPVSASLPAPAIPISTRRAA